MQLNREGYTFTSPTKLTKFSIDFYNDSIFYTKKGHPKATSYTHKNTKPPPYPTKNSIAKSTSKLIPTKADFAPLETRLGFTTPTKKSLAK